MIETTSSKKVVFERDRNGDLKSATVLEFKELTSDAKNRVVMQYHPDCTKKEVWQLLEVMTEIAKQEYLKAAETGGLI